MTDLGVLTELPVDEVLELLCREHLGVWVERKRRLTNAPLHWEWAELAMRETRLAVVAPRDHSKSETFGVNLPSWSICYNPGIKILVLAAEGDLAKEAKARIDQAVAQADPDLLANASERNARKTVYANGAELFVRTTGQRVRGFHPDLIIGDDVLEEQNTLTHYQRKKVERWWFGTIEGMAHPGTWRIVNRQRVWFPPTRLFLVGTPFHQSDLLMSMRTNPVYRFRRYAAEFDPEKLVNGSLAIEAS